MLSAKENKHLYNFFIRYGNLRFAYLGLQLNVGKNTQVTVNPAFKDKVADVYCFVDDRRNCMRVGKMDKGTLLLDDDFKEMANGRLLFTTEPAVAVSDFQKELRKNENEVDIQKIKWPEFWPNNLRGF